MKRIVELIKKLLSSEIVRYVIAGGTVTVSNYVIFFVLNRLMGLYQVANVISLILSKTIGYVMNKFFVYHSRTEGAGEFFAELFRFILARGFTGLVDFFGLILLVEVFGIDPDIGKWIVMLLVMVLNYILGKKAVFKRKEEVSENGSRGEKD